MNVIVMIGMMGLMLLFFHGRGHHHPAAAPADPKTRPAVSPAVPPTSQKAAHPAAERPSGGVDHLAISPEEEPTPVSPTAPEAE